jgi:hypothetical protein
MPQFLASTVHEPTPTAYGYEDGLLSFIAESVRIRVQYVHLPWDLRIVQSCADIKTGVKLNESNSLVFRNITCSTE